AAKRNHVKAQVRLGLLLEAGEEIVRNPTGAYVWLGLADAQVSATSTTEVTAEERTRVTQALARLAIALSPREKTELDQLLAGELSRLSQAS
ncbi:MAG: hypothetical protein ABT940_14810, partial [Alphaproteobacteria bacterium]